MKIIQVATATAAGESGTEIKRTVCVDERGQAWELHGAKSWTPLPTLPDCLCPLGGTINPACDYHRRVRGA